MHEFPGPQDRIRRILERALVDCTYESSRLENGSSLVLRARRTDGGAFGVRFRGVKDSETDSPPEPGAPLQLKAVRRESIGLISRFLPIFKPPGPAYARVRIEAGSATLEIVCQDAEWWEE